MKKIIPLIIINVFLLTIGQILWKKTLNEIPLNLNYEGFIRLIKDPFIWFGLILFGIATVLWFYILSKANLSFVYPLQSICYPLGMFAGFYLFKEQINFYQILGIFFILLGVYFIGQHA